MTEEQTTETEETTEELPPNLAEGSDGGSNLEQPSDDEPESFPREYVEELRQEAAKHRTRAGDRDELAARLHTALVSASGRLADPTDLPYDDAHLTDEDELSSALDSLLTRKPHLASRRVSGDVGQGATGSGEAVDLAGMLRANAG